MGREQVLDRATTSSFAVLAPYGPLYLAIGAERALVVDPRLTLVSLRQLSEAFARHAAARAGLLADNRDGSGSPLDLLRSLEQRGIVRDQIAEIFHMLRRAGNPAAHDLVGTHQDLVKGLQLGFKLACWFHRAFGDAHAPGSWKPPMYVLPAAPIATLRTLQEAANRARAEADAHKADAVKAKLPLEAEAARRAEEASLRKTAEAARHEWEALAQAFENDLKQATSEQAKLVEATSGPSPVLIPFGGAALADRRLRLAIEFRIPSPVRELCVAYWACRRRQSPTRVREWPDWDDQAWNAVMKRSAPGGEYNKTSFALQQQTGIGRRGGRNINVCANTHYFD